MSGKRVILSLTLVLVVVAGNVVGPVIVVRVEPGGVVDFVATGIEIVGGEGGIASEDFDVFVGILVVVEACAANNVEATSATVRDEVGRRASSHRHS